MQVTTIDDNVLVCLCKKKMFEFFLYASIVGLSLTMCSQPVALWLTHTTSKAQRTEQKGAGLWLIKMKKV